MLQTTILQIEWNESLNLVELDSLRIEMRSPSQ